MRIPQHVLVALRLLECNSVARSANRTTFTLADDSIEYALVVRDKREPDNHSREELYAMLRTVRACERIQNWQCPEPTEHEIQGAARRMMPPRIP